MFKDKVICPVSKSKHTVVYKDVNKDKIIDHCNKKLDELVQDPKKILIYAIDIEGKMKFDSIDDLGIIQFAQFHSNDRKQLKYMYNPNYLYHVNIRNGFIVIEPDDEIKRAISNLFNHPRVYKVFFNITRDLTSLFNNGIKFEDNIIDTQAIDSSKMMNNYSLADAIKNLGDNIDLAQEAKKLLNDKKSVNFGEKLIKYMKLSDDEAFEKYGEILQYASNDILFTALSFFNFYKSFGTITNGMNCINKTKIEQFMFSYNKTHPLYSVVYVSCQFLKLQIKDPQNYRKNPYSTLARICALEPHFDLIESKQIDFISKEEFEKIRKECELLIITTTSDTISFGSDTKTVADYRSFKAKFEKILDDMKIEDPLKDIFSQKMTILDYSKAGSNDPEAIFKTICHEMDEILGTDTYDILCDLRDSPDAAERRSSQQEIFNEITNHMQNSNKTG